MSEIINLTATIVSAHVANHEVDPAQLPGLIRDVYGALTSVQDAPLEPAAAGPIVDPHRSVFPDHILCLDCGKPFKMIKRHLSAYHQMTPAQYRGKWGLPGNYPMVAPNYIAIRSQIAIDSGLGHKVAPPPPEKLGGRPRYS